MMKVGEENILNMSVVIQFENSIFHLQSKGIQNNFASSLWVWQVVFFYFERI